jgi:hypothetical protein
MNAISAVTIEKTAYQGWPNSYRISNGEVELVVTSDIGPRVMRFGFAGGQNFFKEFAEGLGKSGEAEWQPRGGHRLWVGPEDLKYTYAPDNGPVQVEVQGETLIATQPVEPSTGLEKQLVIRLAPSGSRVEVIHRITNRGNFPLEFAPWALTMMAQGGTGITGFPPRGTHPEDLDPTNPLVMWAYTDFSDPRWTFTKKYVMLRQDRTRSDAQKLGTFNTHTWGGYFLNKELFLKQTKATHPREYPDFGCSFETFSNGDMLELETFGPMSKVAAGATVEHVEVWSLHRNVPQPAANDAALDAVLLPLLK